VIEIRTREQTPDALPGTTARRIAAIPGDGIGKEVIPEGVRLLSAIARKRQLALRFDELPYGADRYLATGETLPPSAIGTLREGYAAILFGAVGDPRVPDNRHAAEILLALRRGLDLYVNFRPARLFTSQLSPLKDKRPSDIDLVVFRENTEGAYSGIGGSLHRGTPEEVAVNEDVNTARGVSRIIRAALDYARRTGKRRVCMADKANAMGAVGELWQRCWKAAGEDYPEIERRHLYIDALCMELVRAPEQFDVIVTSNMFGDIVSDLAIAIVGGPGLGASANINPARRIGLFEPVHGSAPSLAGRGIANPLATFLTCALLLDHLGHAAEARIVESAVAHILHQGWVTPDLGGHLNTIAVTDAVIHEVEWQCDDRR
jgi:3-isopropylmalate dehydrogenase